MFTITSQKSNTLVDVIRQDIEKIRNAPIQELYTEIQTILKTLVGKSHEYTLEESLFVLWGEKIITEEEYIQLKKNIVSLVYTKYATNHDKKPQLDFDQLKEQLLSAARKSQTSLEQYEQIKAELRTYPEENKEISNVKKHKKEIYLAEQELFESMQESENDPEIIVETKEQKEEPQLEPIVTEDEIEQPYAQINFPEIYYKITKIELKDLNALKKRAKTNSEEIWDLYVKYCIMEKIDPTRIIKELNDESKSIEQILNALDRNAHYEETIKDILYMKDIIHVTLAITYTYVRDLGTNYIKKQLKKQGYKDALIAFVEGQMFDRIKKI